MRFRIDFMPRIDHDHRRDADRQRWSPGTVIVQGEAGAERELQAHEADYGPELVFRATPVEDLATEPCAYVDCEEDSLADGYCKRHTGNEYQPTSAEEDDPYCQGDNPRRAHD